MLHHTRVAVAAGQSSVETTVRKAPKQLSPSHEYSFGGEPLRPSGKPMGIEPAPIAMMRRTMPGGVPPTSAQATFRDTTVSQTGKHRDLGEPLARTWAPFDREVSSSKKSVTQGVGRVTKLGGTLAAVRRPEAHVRQHPLMPDRENALRDSLNRSGNVFVSRSDWTAPEDRLRALGTAVAPGPLLSRPAALAAVRRRPAPRPSWGHPGLTTGPHAGGGAMGGPVLLGDAEPDAAGRIVGTFVQGVVGAVVVAALLTTAAVGGLYWWSTREN